MEVYLDDDTANKEFDSGEKIYYRLNIYGKRPNYIISNPIFVKLLQSMVKE